MKPLRGESNELVVGQDAALDDGLPKASLGVALKQFCGLESKSGREHWQKPSIANGDL